MSKELKKFSERYVELIGTDKIDKIVEVIKEEKADISESVIEESVIYNFWFRYYCMLQPDQILLLGIQKAAITGDMYYMLNGIYQANRFWCVYQNSGEIEGLHAKNIIEIVLAYACNDYTILDKIMPKDLGVAIRGYSAPYYNMIYAMTYHDQMTGDKAYAELQAFMEKKHPQFDLLIAGFLSDLYQKDIVGINEKLQKLCNSMGRCCWIKEHIFGLDEEIGKLGNSVAIFVHGLYHLAVKYLEKDPLVEEITMPKHKNFITEYEKFNFKNDFPKPQNLIDFDFVAKFINVSIQSDVIPEITLANKGKIAYVDGKQFEKSLFENMKKYGVLDVKREGKQYVFKKIE